MVAEAVAATKNMSSPRGKKCMHLLRAADPSSSSASLLRQRQPHSVLDRHRPSLGCTPGLSTPTAVLQGGARPTTAPAGTLCSPLEALRQPWLHQHQCRAACTGTVARLWVHSSRTVACQTSMRKQGCSAGHLVPRALARRGPAHSRRSPSASCGNCLRSRNPRSGPGIHSSHHKQLVLSVQTYKHSFLDSFFIDNLHV